MKVILLFLFAIVMHTAHAGDVGFHGTKPAIIIDVRTPEEFIAGHLDGAVNMPLDQLNTKIKTATRIGKESPILVYCRSGHRSGLAKVQLKQMGYTRIFDGGGMSTLAGQLKPCGPKTC